jgi:tetratricopeptide (TPR) repeat protein
VDTQTRHALKQNSFADATASSVNWLSGHRSGVLRWVIVAVVVVVAGVASLVFWNMRSADADNALGAALEAYNAPLAQPGAPALAGVYASANDRSKAANQQFVAVAEKYGWLAEGAKAHYFAGVTYEDLGQNGPAETELKAAAGSWDRNLANLAKLALAGLYHQTNRDSEAIALYTALTAKPSETVSAAVAQLDLADLYAATGNQAKARELWAKVQDADKEGAAGSIAAQKLGPKQ